MGIESIQPPRDPQKWIKEVLFDSVSETTQTCAVIKILDQGIECWGAEGTNLYTHAKDENHHFSFNNIKILAYEENCKKRKIREIPEILKLNNTVN